MAATSSRRAWRGFRSVLCPVDFSAPSRSALRFAAAIAVHAGARLTVVYVNDPLLVAAASAALRDREVISRSEKELGQFVARTLGTRPQPSRVDVRVAVGAAADQITTLSRSIGAEVIVMGTHGLSGPRRVFLGSTTLAVLKRSRVPVLACPPSWRLR